MSKQLFTDFETLADTAIQYAHNAHNKTKQFIDNDDYAESTQNAILKQLQDNKNIAFCEEHSGKMFHFFQDSHYPKGVYRVSSTSMYRAGLPDWTILFSIADFDDVLHDDVYLTGIQHCETQANLILIELSPQGTDASYIIEFDLATLRIVENGFHFPLGKSHVTWQTPNSVFVCPAWDGRQLTDSAYSRQVWLMQRGQIFSEAEPIYQCEQTDVSIDAWRYLDAQGTDIDLMVIRHDFFHHSYYQINNQRECQKLNIPATADVCGYLGGYLLLIIKEDWHRAKHSFVAGSLLAVKLQRGKLGLAYCLFEPQTMQTIECVETSRNFVLIHYLDKVQAHLSAWKLKHDDWYPQQTPELESLNLELVDQPWGGDVFYFVADDLIHPPVLYAWNAIDDELSVIRRQPEIFNSDSISIKQYFATSQDGTLIPYFWCGKTAQQNTPTIIYLYGGFGLNQLPHYLGNIGKHWLEEGYAFVIANIRGGAELGPSWHSGAQKEHKQRSIDDLSAVIDDLHQNKRSSPQYTAIQGGSNGGLIVAATMVQHSEKINAVICEMPLIDMLGYHRLGSGASWLAEYGDPEDQVARKYLSALSPLEQLQDKRYPAILITTDLNDDRVHPSHALKLYAQLQETSSPVYLYLNEAGGHNGNGTQQHNAEELSCILSFLRLTIVNQQDVTSRNCMDTLNTL